MEKASRYVVCRTYKYGEIVEMIEKPEDPPSNLTMTGFCALIIATDGEPSNRGERVISEVIDLPLQG